MYDDKDRLLFIDTVGEVSDRFDVDVFAFVLCQTTITSFCEPTRQIRPRLCNGLGLPILEDSIPATVGPAIYFSGTFQEYCGGAGIVKRITNGVAIPYTLMGGLDLNG